MVSGEADAVIIDSISGRLYLKNNPEAQVTTKYSQTAVTEEPFALVTRIGDHVLLKELNDSLGRLKANGALKTIDQRWLG
jgi:ABC-type amino acid transport substrate-binding protein